MHLEVDYLFRVCDVLSVVHRDSELFPKLGPVDDVTIKSRKVHDQLGESDSRGI